MKMTMSLVAGVMLMLAGCASHEVVPSSGPRTPTNPEQVMLHQKQPKKYERLGTVSLEITKILSWDEKGEANAAFEQIKKQAAALGANGLLMWAEPGTTDVAATAGYKGKFYQVPIKREGTKRTAVAEAIYVIESE